MVSNVGDAFAKKWPGIEPIQPNVYPNREQVIEFVQGVSRAEFEALKKEVEELRELLKAAKKFDDATGQPDCENDEKLAALRAVAEALGVDLGEFAKVEESS